MPQAESPTGLAPPAYEISQQQFDRKLEQAEELSRVAQNRAVSEPMIAEEWEEWDEAAFEAATSRRSASRSPTLHSPGNSQHSVVRRSSTSKRTLDTGDCFDWKVVPSTGAEVAAPTDIPVHTSHDSSSSCVRTQEASSVPYHHVLPLEDEDDTSIPPPPFTPTTHRHEASFGPNFLTYNDRTVLVSHAMPQMNISLHPSSPSSPGRRSPHFLRTSASAAAGTTTPKGPRMGRHTTGFNHLMAYASQSSRDDLAEDTMFKPHDPAAFYNSAVSSLVQNRPLPRCIQYDSSCSIQPPQPQQAAMTLASQIRQPRVSSVSTTSYPICPQNADSPTQTMHYTHYATNQYLDPDVRGLQHVPTLASLPSRIDLGSLNARWAMSEADIARSLHQ